MSLVLAISEDLKTLAQVQQKLGIRLSEDSNFLRSGWRRVIRSKKAIVADWTKYAEIICTRAKTDPFWKKRSNL